MSKESKLYLLRNRKDYIKKLTNDDVINVIGTKGSGKTTSTIKYINNDDYIVINCDRLYEMPTDKVVEDKYLAEIKSMLKKKYGKINDNVDLCIMLHVGECTDCFKWDS